MSATNTMETALLNLFFKGTTFANIADNAASSPLTSFYLSLHSSDPSDAGDQTTGETAYTGYARVAVVRTGSGWTVSGNQASNAASITFGQCTANAETLRYVGLGSASTGTGVLYLVNPLLVAIPLSVGSIPLFGIGDLVFTCD